VLALARSLGWLSCVWIEGFLVGLLLKPLPKGGGRVGGTPSKEEIVLASARVFVVVGWGNPGLVGLNISISKGRIETANFASPCNAISNHINFLGLHIPLRLISFICLVMRIQHRIKDIQIASHSIF